MKKISRWCLGLMLLAALGAGGWMTRQADAGMICQDGRWMSVERHCQLGTAVNCSECWVWVK